MNFKTELKEFIIETLDLEDIEPEDIDDDEPLFVDGLGLDSIDALELGLAIKQRYGVKLEASDSQTREHFRNINSLTNLISAHIKEETR